MLLRLPRVGMEMTEGVVARWHAEDGQHVVAGQALYDLESDKAESEIESPATGVLRRIARPGETYAVGAPVAEIIES